MPEKSGRAHTEADFVYSLCLGVDALKIIPTAIIILQLLFVTIGRVAWEGPGRCRGHCGVQLCRSGTGEPTPHFAPSAFCLLHKPEGSRLFQTEAL